MANKHVKRFSTSLGIRRDTFTPARMAVIKRAASMWRNRNPHTLLVGMQNGVPT